MPNNVTNRLTFLTHDDYQMVKAGITNTHGLVDFNTLIPCPPNVYLGNLAYGPNNRNDETTFPLNWSSWNRTNWGTKWNAYETCFQVSEDGSAFIQFDTAWTVPYPFIVALANTFKIPFVLEYYDEGANFWGSEAWKLAGGADDSAMTRFDVRESMKEDKHNLCLKLKKYDLFEREKKYAEDAAFNG